MEKNEIHIFTCSHTRPIKEVLTSIGTEAGSGLLLFLVMWHGGRLPFVLEILIILHSPFLHFFFHRFDQLILFIDTRLRENRIVSVNGKVMAVVNNYVSNLNIILINSCYYERKVTNYKRNYSTDVALTKFCEIKGIYSKGGNDIPQIFPV